MQELFTDLARALSLTQSHALSLALLQSDSHAVFLFHSRSLSFFIHMYVHVCRMLFA